MQRLKSSLALPSPMVKAAAYSLFKAGLLMCMALGCAGPQARADPFDDSEQQAPEADQEWDGSFNLGVGLGFTEATGALPNPAAGWDFLAGFEQGVATKGWYLGAQVHYFNGSGISDTDLQVLGAYATARPEYEWLQWLQFKAGIISANYYDQSQVYDPGLATMVTQRTAWSGTGAALGAGVVVGTETFKFHFLDVHRYFVAGQSFNVYSISLIVLVDLLGRK